MEVYVIVSDYDGDLGVSGVWTSREEADKAFEILENENFCALYEEDKVYYKLVTVDLDKGLEEIHWNY